MEHKAFEYGAQHAILILKYVKENEGCTVVEVKQHLGIPLRLPPIISPIQPANRISIEIAIRLFEELVGKSLLKLTRAPSHLSFGGQ